MNKVIRSMRLSLSILGLLAIVMQMRHGLLYNDLVISNFFSYFTIQSNILIVLLLVMGTFLSAEKFNSSRFQIIRGAVTTYIMTTGIVYFLFLRGMEAELQTTIPWVNFVLHTLLPLYALFDWLVIPSRKTIAFRRMWLWLLYPIGYLIYTMLRGLMVKWYPYPFLNPLTSSYGQVLISSIFITGLILLCALIVVGSLRLREWSARRIEIE